MCQILYLKLMREFTTRYLILDMPHVSDKGFFNKQADSFDLCSIVHGVALRQVVENLYLVKTTRLG